jgi:hypothetical protein
MKLIKAIKLHIRLRVRQELLCDDCVMWSQRMYMCQDYKVYPKLSEFSAINSAVKRIEKKLPNIYFFLSDLLGGRKRLKQRIVKQKYKI